MTARCPHCLALVPRSPSRLTRAVVIGGAWIVMMAIVFGLSLIGPFVIPVIPFAVFAGIGLVGGAYEYAHADRVCDTCGRAYELDGERVESPVAVEPKPLPVFAS
jgi:hypothetical protein